VQDAKILEDVEITEILKKGSFSSVGIKATDLIGYEHQKIIIKSNGKVYESRILTTAQAKDILLCLIPLARQGQKWGM
jgi:hypothetical protein